MILNENQVNVLVANLGQEKADTIVEALRLKKDLERELEKVTTTQKSDKANTAFISGMIMGWASRLQKLTPKGHNVETFKLIDDMKEESKRLAELAGVVIE